MERGGRKAWKTAHPQRREGAGKEAPSAFDGRLHLWKEGSDRGKGAREAFEPALPKGERPDRGKGAEAWEKPLPQDSALPHDLRERAVSEAAVPKGDLPLWERPGEEQKHWRKGEPMVFEAERLFGDFPPGRRASKKAPPPETSGAAEGR